MSTAMWSWISVPRTKSHNSNAIGTMNATMVVAT